jgi:hypothetical protein
LNAVEEILAGRRGTVFAPIVYRLAAALEGLDEEELADPATAVYALTSARQLFDLPAVFASFRPAGDEAGEVGLETARRLVAQLGEATPVVGVLDGAWTLDLGRGYLEAGVAALLVADPAGAEALDPLANIASFFSRPLLRLDQARTVPLEALATEPEEWLQGEPGLLLSAGEVAADTDPERLRAWCDAFAEAPR